MVTLPMALESTQNEILAKTESLLLLEGEIDEKLGLLRTSEIEVLLGNLINEVEFVLAKLGEVLASSEEVVENTEGTEQLLVGAIGRLDAILAEVRQSSANVSTTQITNTSVNNLVTAVNSYLAGSGKKLISIQYFVDASLTPTNRCFVTERA